jgi:hypothetical protein
MRSSQRPPNPPARQKTPEHGSFYQDNGSGRYNNYGSTEEEQEECGEIVLGRNDEKQELEETIDATTGINFDIKQQNQAVQSTNSSQPPPSLPSLLETETGFIDRAKLHIVTWVFSFLYGDEQSKILSQGLQNRSGTPSLGAGSTSPSPNSPQDIHCQSSTTVGVMELEATRMKLENCLIGFEMTRKRHSDQHKSISQSIMQLLFKRKETMSKITTVSQDIEFLKKDMAERRASQTIGYSTDSPNLSHGKSKIYGGLSAHVPVTPDQIARLVGAKQKLAVFLNSINTKLLKLNQDKQAASRNEAIFTRAVETYKNLRDSLVINATNSQMLDAINMTKTVMETHGLKDSKEIAKILNDYERVVEKTQDIHEDLVENPVSAIRVGLDMESLTARGSMSGESSLSSIDDMCSRLEQEILGVNLTDFDDLNSLDSFTQDASSSSSFHQFDYPERKQTKNHKSNAPKGGIVSSSHSASEISEGGTSITSLADSSPSSVSQKHGPPMSRSSGGGGVSYSQRDLASTDSPKLAPKEQITKMHQRQKRHPAYNHLEGNVADIYGNSARKRTVDFRNALNEI